MAETESRLEKFVGRAIGVAVGAGATAVGYYYPELVPYMAIGGVAVGSGARVFSEMLKEPKRFLGRVVGYCALASALVVGGNNIGKSNERIQSVRMPPSTNGVLRVFLENRQSRVPYFEYKGTNANEKVFLPMERIVEIESGNLKRELNSLFEAKSKYK